jgi:pyruvate,water dikinase
MSFIRWIKGKEELALPSLFQTFRELLEQNNQALELMADMGEKLSGDYLFDRHYIESIADELGQVVYKVVYNLNRITQQKYLELFDAFEKAKERLQTELDSRFTIPRGELAYPLAAVNREMADYVGEKMATLGDIRNRLGFPVPEGFVISTYAYKKFIEYNGLDRWVESFAKAVPDSADGEGEEKSRDLVGRILQGKIPSEIQKEIQRSLSQLNGEDSPDTGFALRSSALGEDGQSSYAGQYRTLLNLLPSQIFEGYKEVVASLFSPQVTAYRQGRRAEQREMAMAVGCIRMVPSRVSGVLYTADPVLLDMDRIVISACWGLGKLAVEGEGEVDQFVVSRTFPHPVLTQKIGKKDKQYILSDRGGIVCQPVPREWAEKISLDEPSVRQLVEGSLRIEQYMKSFQDIEWAIDPEGRIFFLQARTLEKRWDLKAQKGTLATAARNYPVLLEGAGLVASRGVGAGTAFLVRSEEEARNFPRGAVLVLKRTSARMSKLVPLASAVVTDIGVVTGHMATICREFRVPAIVDTLQATQVLHTGMEVTVDAEENVIYRGVVRELLTAQLIEKIPYEETYEFKLLRRILKRVSTLHLTDPQAIDFHARHCTTYHDILRFAHEMAVRKIAQGIQPKQLGPRASVRKLKIPIPLDLVLVDIGGGILEGVSSQKISLEQMSCLPLQVLLKSLTDPGVWQSLPVDLDLKGLISSLTNPIVSSTALKINLAIISREYFNLSLRLGYHFNMIDAYMGDDRNSNYIYFRFFGGVTEIIRRTRRAKLLAEILEKSDFAVESKGDLVIARIKKINRQSMEEKFRLLGRLIGFTRQLDVSLRSESDIEFFVDQFFHGGMEMKTPSVDPEISRSRETGEGPFDGG